MAPATVVHYLPVAVGAVQLSAAALVVWCWRVHLALAQGPLSAHEGGGPSHLQKESLSGGQPSGGGRPSLKFEPSIWRESLGQDRERDSGSLGPILLAEYALCRKAESGDQTRSPGLWNWKAVRSVFEGRGVCV